MGLLVGARKVEVAADGIAFAIMASSHKVAPNCFHKIFSLGGRVKMFPGVIQGIASTVNHLVDVITVHLKEGS